MKIQKDLMQIPIRMEIDKLDKLPEVQIKANLKKFKADKIITILKNSTLRALILKIPLSKAISNLVNSEVILSPDIILIQLICFSKEPAYILLLHYYLNLKNYKYQLT